MTGYQTGPGNQLLNDGLWTYTFDSEGNEIQKNSGSGEKWKYSYDLLNHLTSAIDINSSGVTVTYATYVYDVFGNRIEKDVWTSAGSNTTTRFGYDIGAHGASALAGKHDSSNGRAISGSLANAWVDMNGSNQLQMRRIILDGLDQIVARIDTSGIVSWYLIDHLGSVRGLMNNSGTLIDQQATTPMATSRARSAPPPVTGTNTPAGNAIPKSDSTFTGRGITARRQAGL